MKAKSSATTKLSKILKLKFYNHDFSDGCHGEINKYLAIDYIKKNHSNHT